MKNQDHAGLLKASIQLIVDSSFIVYHPDQIKELTGIQVDVSMVGADLLEVVNHRIEMSGDDLDPIDYRDERHEDPATPRENWFKSEYAEGKESSYLFKNNTPLVDDLRFIGKDMQLITDETIKDMFPDLHAGPDLSDPRLAKTKHTLNCVLASLLKHHNENMHTRISLAESYYKGKSLSYTTISKFLKYLESAGIAEVIKGSRAKNGHEKGLSTLVRLKDHPFTDSLMAKYQRREIRYHKNSAWKSFISQPHRERVEVQELPDLTQDLFAIYKPLMESTNVYIKYGATDDASITCLPHLKFADMDGIVGYDLADLLPIHQVFNDEDLSTGGRQYCMATGIKSALRDLIMFDGEETVEVDLKASHISILATQHGVVAPFDPYVFGKLDRENNKGLVMRGINCKTKAQATKTVANHLSENGLKIKAVDWFTDLYTSQAWIIPHIGSNAGLHLQMTEAVIMQNAMINFMEQTETFALCYHDGLRVQKKHAQVAIDCIFKAIADQFFLANKSLVEANFKITCEGRVYYFDSQHGVALAG
jgi:hypothetical protein